MAQKVTKNNIETTTNKLVDELLSLRKFITYWTDAQGHYSSQYTQME